MGDNGEDDLFRGATDDEGARRPTAAGRWRDPWEKRKLIAQLVLASACMLSMLAFITVPVHVDQAREASEFSMELTGSEGLNATTDSTVSPVFGLKVHIDNPRVLLSWCYNGGEVVVSYSNVALAWGHVPRFCIHKGVPTEFTVLPWGRAVGLSDDLRRRLALDWHTGKGQILVEMKLFCVDQVWLSKRYHGPLLHKFQLMLRGGKHIVN
ncbi:hypothetical protein BAE44_0002685 [Dichanthelium oligosanthes]|uniref:Late embryogenesis abundant protein LEA-2 subgroup domain-containing protein n=1 Tax=Dichanthelium oligosanthes TaxID=888268 RepID=A0A1E5WFW7_9POAL|nr:hypothetical protein BAE44_0002685 [Dichanthelium oligosanthes]